jgi:hypothetical protein
MVMNDKDQCQKLYLPSPRFALAAALYLAANFILTHNCPRPIYQPIPKQVPISQLGDGTTTDRLSPVTIKFKQYTIQAGDVLSQNVKKSA